MTKNERAHEFLKDKYPDLLEQVSQQHDHGYGSVAAACADYASLQIKLVADAMKKFTPELADDLIREWYVASGQELMDALKKP